jgi:hypothetical protein
MEDKEQKQPEKLVKSLNTLDKDVQELDKDIKHLSAGQRGWRSLFSGTLSGLGTVIGATVIIGLIIFLLQKLSVLPGIGEAFSVLLHQLQKKP